MIAATEPRPSPGTVALAAAVALALVRTRRAQRDEWSAQPAHHPATRPDPGRPDDRRRDAVVDGVRSMVRDHVPAGGEVLVISRGDPALVDLEPARGRHFPADELGVWAGYHPALGTAAALLDAQRGTATHLALPATGGWWLDTYPELAAALGSAELVAQDDSVGWLWRLAPPGPSGAPATTGFAASSGPAPVPDPGLDAYRTSITALTRLLDALGSPGELAAVVSRGDDAFCATRVVRSVHFPGDPDGRYDGHPADDLDARRRLADAAARGVSWLAVPADSAWWSDHYPGFWHDLRHQHRTVVDRDGIGRIARLAPSLPEST